MGAQPIRAGRAQLSETPIRLSRRFSAPSPNSASPPGSIAEGLERSLAGWTQRLGHMRKKVEQALLDHLAHRRIVVHGLAQEPGAVGDVALLVGRDPPVAVREAREQLPLREQVEQEVGGDDAQGPLEDHVVDRHEVDLGLAIAGIEAEPVVGLHQSLVEDVLERLAQNLARPRHVRGDRPGIRDHLVLEAGVELHVPDLVDELRREEAALLLVVLRQHQPDELGRDPLLGDHQRAEREVEELALGLVEPGPVGRVAAEVDVLGRPVGVLPVEVELLRVLEGCLRGHGVARNDRLPAMIFLVAGIGVRRARALSRFGPRRPR